MDDYESLSHTKWECKYHVVFIPKCRRKTLYAELRRHLGEVFRRLAQQKDCKMEEGHLLPDHVRVDFDTTEIRIAGDRVYQGEERHTSGAGIRRKEAQLRRSALLGKRVLRIHSGSRHRGHTGVHQEAGRGGQAPGAIESVAVTAAFRRNTVQLAMLAPR